MLKLDEKLLNALTTNERKYIGFGYRQLKDAACVAAQIYGSKWAYKYPETIEDIYLSNQLRNLVMTNIPKGHSNRDVVWQRFKQYAIKSTENSI